MRKKICRVTAQGKTRGKKSLLNPRGSENKWEISNTNNESNWEDDGKNVSIKLHKTAYNKPFNDDKDYNNDGRIRKKV